MNTEKRRDFLLNLCYWLVIASGVYLALKHLLPISVPVLLGILVTWVVVRISQRFHCTNKPLQKRFCRISAFT